MLTNLSKIIESMGYDAMLKHLKHIDEFKDDERFASCVETLKNDIFRFMRLYNNFADDLALSEAGKSDSGEDVVVGFINKDHNVVKYNKNTQDFVIYNPRSPKLKTSTFHKKTLVQYMSNLNRDFLCELPNNDNVVEDEDDEDFKV